MNALWGWTIYAWVALPTVMYGGYSLLALLTRGDGISEFGRTWFRAGHAHAGVLLVVFLLFIDQLGRTDLSIPAKHTGCALYAIGNLAVAGGFFAHMSVGQEGASSVGNTITTLGAVLLTTAIAMLVYGIAISR